MNAYDFDQTIFNPDSSYAFYMHCLKTYPKAVLKSVPKSIVKAIGYKKKKLTAKELKEQLFSFLPEIPDVDREVAVFWQSKKDGIAAWYLRQKREDDIIISASPEFLLGPICSELGVQLICTIMDKNTGKIIGENCHDKEKVKRLYDAYPDAHVENFYSDSLSDTPMAEIAERAYIVKKENIRPWPVQ